MNRNDTATPEENIIGRKQLSGEPGKFDWGVTKSTDEATIARMKEDYLRYKTIKNKKKKIAKKILKAYKNKTAKKPVKKEKRKVVSPSPSPDNNELVEINAGINRRELFKPIESTKKSSSEPSLSLLDIDGDLPVMPMKKKPRSEDNLEALVYQDRRAHTPTSGLAQLLDSTHINKSRGGNPYSELNEIKRKITDLEKKIQDNKDRKIEVLEDYYQDLAKLEAQLKKLEKEKGLGNTYDVLYKKDMDKLIDAKLDNLRKGGKKKSRRKLRKSGRKTKRRK